MDDLNIAVVCSSNMNRSMEAHAFLARKGFKVKSYGTGKMIRLPGISADQPNCYEFGVSFEYICNDLSAQNKLYYTNTGLLHMLNRNRRIKPRPEKFQDTSERFDVIITCEKRVYNQVIEHFTIKRPVYNQPVHVINIDIADNLEDATFGAFHICDMVTKMSKCHDLYDDINIILNNFESKIYKPLSSCICYY